MMRKALNFQFTMEHEIRTRSRYQSFCKQNVSLDDFKSIDTLSLHNIDWKMMAITSLKMRNLGFRICLESGFSDGSHCLR